MSMSTDHLANFVLKLKFAGSDDETSEIRRVRLPRICDTNGQISYEELVGLAISFVIPEKPAHASDFQVKLTYKDEDDDVVVIGSSEELLDAMDQFKEQHVLRITAEVKRTNGMSVNRVVAEEPASRASPPLIEAGVQTQTTTNNGNGPAPKKLHNPTPVMQHVVESVVNIILNAAVAINGNKEGNQQQQRSPAVFYTPEGVPSQEIAPPVVDTPKEETAVVTTETKEAPEEAPTPTEAAVVPPSEPVKEENTQITPEPTVEEERPFIHGRHTCDSCLTTPIIGKRYHALNMADYDLCAKCHSSYGGAGEIQFEAVELERDRHLQARWNRRRDRMNNGRGCGSGRRFGPGSRDHHTRWGPRPGRRTQPPMAVPPVRGPRGIRGPPYPPPRFAATKGRDEQKASEESAMEMAIRLSLKDLKKDETKQTPEPSAPVETADEKSISTSSNASVGTQERAATKNDVVEPVVVETVKDAEAEEEKEIVIEAEKPAAVPEPSAPLEEEVKSHAESVVEPVKVETVEDEGSIQSDSFVVRMPTLDGSFASELSAIHQTQPCNGIASKEGSRESSFTSDAAGNGDVADLLGETLDKCAQAIDAMVSELDRTHSSGVNSADTSFVGLNDEPEEESVAEQEDAVVDEGTATEGATILESVGNAATSKGSDASEAERSEDGWQVVNEDQQIGSDEELARAAQMIGSALFNSDMRSSTTLTGSAVASDIISCASSALTSVPSVSSNIVAEQRERWASQLEQLHSLGISDDARSVEILERLTAANIGCDSTDEVSVQDVINELWK